MMLKRTIPALILAFAAIALVAPFQAQAQNAEGGYKIGVVDVQKVVADYDKRKQEYAKLEEQVKQRQTKIDALSAEITQMKDSYDAKAKSGNAVADEMFQLEQQIQSKYATYQSELSIQQREIDRMEAEVLEKVFGDIEKAIAEYANTNNYHIILNGRPGPRGTVLFHAAGVDVTSAILGKLNGK